MSFSYAQSVIVNRVTFNIQFLTSKTNFLIVFLQVGYDTVNCSEDQILKQDMPPSLSRVEEASHFLLQASQLLKADPFSAPARQKLIEGSRGKIRGLEVSLKLFLAPPLPSTKMYRGLQMQVIANSLIIVVQIFKFISYKDGLIKI